MPRRATVLEHVPHEGPARVANALERAGFELTRVPLHAGAAPPGRLDQQDLLVVMGGPMGVEDLGSDRYPFLAPEL